MINSKPLWRGNPLEGAVFSGTTDNVRVFELPGAQVPQWKTWLIESITVCNMTPVTGYYSVAIFPDTSDNADPLYDAGAVNTAVDPVSSIAGGAGTIGPRRPGDSEAVLGVPYGKPGFYLAFSQPILRRTTETIPLVAWATSLEKLWAGVSPGFNGLIGAGGIMLMISGCEVRG